MALILKKNHSAYTELVNRHTSRFYALAYRTLFDKVTAEDIVQDAFLTLWRAPHRWKLERGAKFTTWFYKIVINLCFDHNKKKTPLPLDEAFDIADECSNLERVFDQDQKQQIIDKAIAQLPEAQRTALNLCFYEKVSNQQAATIMDLKLKALQSLLIRAKNALKKNVKPLVRRAG